MEVWERYLAYTLVQSSLNYMTPVLKYPHNRRVLLTQHDSSPDGPLFYITDRKDKRHPDTHAPRWASLEKWGRQENLEIDQCRKSPVYHRFCPKMADQLAAHAIPFKCWSWNHHVVHIRRGLRFTNALPPQFVYYFRCGNNGCTTEHHDCAAHPISFTSILFIRAGFPRRQYTFAWLWRSEAVSRNHWPGRVLHIRTIFQATADIFEQYGETSYLVKYSDSGHSFRSGLPTNSLTAIIAPTSIRLISQPNHDR